MMRFTNLLSAVAESLFLGADDLSKFREIACSVPNPIPASVSGGWNQGSTLLTEF